MSRRFAPHTRPPEDTDPNMQTMATSLDLTREDTELLRDVIRHYLGELHDEIVHTENYDFREALHAKQRRLNELLEQLGNA